jgi:hypothetical protein
MGSTDNLAGSRGRGDRTMTPEEHIRRLELELEFEREENKKLVYDRQDQLEREHRITFLMAAQMVEEIADKLRRLGGDKTKAE